jgi:hypothetical protein
MTIAEQLHTRKNPVLHICPNKYRSGKLDM